MEYEFLTMYEVQTWRVAIQTEFFVVFLRLLKYLPG
jgi:hypothetical protein